MTSTRPPLSVVRCVLGGMIRIEGEEMSTCLFGDSDTGYQDGEDKTWEGGTKPEMGKGIENEGLGSSERRGLDDKGQQDDILMAPVKC